METRFALAVVFCIAALTLPSLDAAQGIVSSRKLMGTHSRGDSKDGGKLMVNEFGNIVVRSHKLRALRQEASASAEGDAVAFGDNTVTGVTTEAAAAVSPEGAAASAGSDSSATADSGVVASSGSSTATAGKRKLMKNDADDAMVGSLKLRALRDASGAASGEASAEGDNAETGVTTDVSAVVNSDGSESAAAAADAYASGSGPASASVTASASAGRR